MHVARVSPASTERSSTLVARRARRLLPLAL